MDSPFSLIPNILFPFPLDFPSAPNTPRRKISDSLLIPHANHIFHSSLLKPLLPLPSSTYFLLSGSHMAEEHPCQAPQLCANNCGFFGSPATQNMCSKCFRDFQLKQQQSSSAKLVLNQTLASSSLTIPQSPLQIHGDSSSPAVDPPIEVPAQPPAQATRCLTCRRRVGLTGFKCRCGSTFCGSHRYPEQHGCEFDFKGMDREQIAKANPVVKGEKLDKI